LKGYFAGYPVMVTDTTTPVYASLIEDYAARQKRDNVAKTHDFLVPILRSIGANRVLDAGCGLGTMVMTLLEMGYDAYGFDLLESVPHWIEQKLPSDRFIVTEPLDLRLPFEDAVFDAVFTFGVLEHVGTSDGHATRRPDYHAIRREWTRELFRVVRPGGYLLLGGPNRGFPIDTAHALDAEAGRLEHALSRLAGVSVHRTWGKNFLWSYRDVRTYLDGLQFTMTPLSVKHLANFSRVPGPVRAVARAYVERLPNFLLGTGFNPWVMALVRRES
jgi:SAM-dependent methyltransferase